MQFSLFESTSDTSSSYQLPLEDADVQYMPNWLSDSEASTAYQTLAEQLPWQQDTIKLFGKSVKIPRMQSWHGDATTVYSYSGLVMRPKPWTPQLAQIREKCVQQTGSQFNSVLANWYRHGQDSMGMHADDEPELGLRPVIASVTLGEPRPFVFCHRKTKNKYKFVLEHGSLLVMAGETQQHYQHGIAKTTKSIGGRINLTYRYIIPATPE